MGLEEEQMAKALGDELGKSQAEVQEMIRRINSLYWGHQIEVGPKSSAAVDPKADKEAALKAAELTLGSSGALEGLALEGREHEELQGAAPKSGWNRMLGAFSGLYSYLQHRMTDHDQRTLVRIVYLSILQQHAAVAARTAENEQEQQAATAGVEKSKQYREVAPTPQRRAIKLEE